MKVLHFKSVFLNESETFIARQILQHVRYDAAAAAMQRRQLCEGLPVHLPPRTQPAAVTNSTMHRLNRTPPFLHRVVRNERPDIIHAHFGLDGYRLIGLRRRSGIPLVVSFYGHDVSRLPGEFGWKRRYRALARSVDRCIVPSQAMRADLARLGFPDSKIDLVRFGVDLRSFAFTARASGGPALVLVGRLVEKKGHADAIEALRRLNEHEQQCTLDFYGDGPLRSDLERLTHRLGVADQVRFHGHVSVDDVRDALVTHDILLAPSVTASDGDREGMPNTVLEGLACGIPVVATRHAGIPEIVRHEVTGLLVDERAPGQLSKAIQRLLDEPLLVQSVSAGGRRVVESQHDVRNVVRALEAVYDKARLTVNEAGPL